MALCDNTLLCNFPKCRVKLRGFAWVTACSHVFCDQHGSGEFSRSPAICPACSSVLSGKLDIVRAELSPSEDYKAMVLAGLPPDTVLDITTRALAFWTYQVNQEQMYQEYSLVQAESQVKQMEKVLAQQNQSRELELSAMRGEIASLKKVMEDYKRKHSEVAEKLMERNRQYQKLQMLYDSLRLKRVGGVREKDARSQSGHLDFNAGVMQQSSPHFPSTSTAGDGQFFSCVDADAAKSFFQFSTPVKDKSRPLVRRH